MTNFGKVYRAISACLVGFDWYVFGAQAAAFYGNPRSTYDVDVTVRTPTLTALFAALENEFEPSIEDPITFAETARVIPAVHIKTGVPVDFVIAGPGLEEGFLSRAKPGNLAGELVPIITVEDLVVSKLLAGRPHDREDVKSVIQSQMATLDKRSVVSILSMLDEALGQSDLKLSFEKILEDLS